jgi:hypothetical protein
MNLRQTLHLIKNEHLKNQITAVGITGLCMDSRLQHHVKPGTNGFYYLKQDVRTAALADSQLRNFIIID